MFICTSSFSRQNFYTFYFELYYAYRNLATSYIRVLIALSFQIFYNSNISLIYGVQTSVASIGFLFSFCIFLVPGSPTHAPTNPPTYLHPTYKLISRFCIFTYTSRYAFFVTQFIHLLHTRYAKLVTHFIRRPLPILYQTKTSGLAPRQFCDAGTDARTVWQRHKTVN